MKERDPYHLALTTLANFAGEGRFGWGEPLVVTGLAEELGLSPTPIREAMARLAGEGMLEHRPGRGYFAPSPTASDIADLYEMHRRLAHWAIDLVPAGWKGTAIDAPIPTRIEALYGGLITTARSEVLIRAYTRTLIQLRPVRRIEAEVAPVADHEILQQERHLCGGQWVALRKAIDAYHHDRTVAAQAVFSVMRRASKSIDTI